MIEVHPDSSDISNSVERSSLTPEQQEYLHELQKIVDFLNNSELKGKWWMIGGIAKDTYIANSKFKFGDADHPRDIDILVKEGNFHALERVRAQNTSKIPVGGFLNRFIYVGTRDSFLHFGAIKTKIAPDLFLTNEVNFFGVKFPTLPPETLFHLYCLRGELRPKDFTSALQIGRFIQENPSSDLSEEKYRNFHEFSKQIQRSSTYPQAIMNKLSKWYDKTALGKALPLSSPVVRPVVLHIWDAAGLIGK